MFAIILILVGGALGLGIGCLIGRGPAPKVLIAVGVLLALFGAGLAAHQSAAMLGAMARQSWPTTDGEIVEACITPANEPMITYRYTVDAESYEGQSNMHAPGFGLGSSRLETAHTILSQLKEQGSVRVFYDPEAPAESRVKPGPSWRIFTRLSFGFCLLVLGCATTVRALRTTPSE
jgi:disulfide bond formation protein DsbB